MSLTTPEPTDLITSDTIKVARTARLANLFKITYRLITEMAAADICKHNHSPDSGTPSSYICTAHNNLGLQRYLSLHAFEYPKIKNAAEIRQSVNDITNILTSTVGIGRCMRTIGVKTLESIQEPPEGPEMGFRHDECRIEYELAERIYHAARSAPWAVTVETMDEMRGNAGKFAQSLVCANADLCSEDECVPRQGVSGGMVHSCAVGDDGNEMMGRDELSFEAGSNRRSARSLWLFDVQ
jgi:hypothetical protein